MQNKFPVFNIYRRTQCCQLCCTSIYIEIKSTSYCGVIYFTASQPTHTSGYCSVITDTNIAAYSLTAIRIVLQSFMEQPIKMRQMRCEIDNDKLLEATSTEQCWVEASLGSDYRKTLIFPARPGGYTLAGEETPTNRPSLYASLFIHCTNQTNMLSTFIPIRLNNYFQKFITTDLRQRDVRMPPLARSPASALNFRRFHPCA